MINITNIVDCCGCNACGDVCAKHAITFKTDIEGFWYPEVNMDLCEDCGLCEKVCPNINIQQLKNNDYDKPSQAIAAVNKSMRIRWNSTSGGAYTALAETMLELGGYVSGAIYNEGFTGVHNYVSNNPEDLEKLRSSKYLQSNAEGLYAEIRELLKTGTKVLACGTPCQMAALRSYLHKNYDNLIIVDFVCRGVNSPKVYRSYLDSLEEKYGSKVVYVKAKNKELGWRNLTRKVTFENGQSYYGVLMDDDFRRGYHTNVYCRPSCYRCQFKDFPRIADITIGDFWGIEHYDKNMDYDIGTSMILLNSKKGERFFEKAKDKLDIKILPFESVLPGNIALRKSLPSAIINRKLFFEDLDTYGFDFVVNKYFPIPQKEGASIKIKIKNKIKGIIQPIWAIYSNCRWDISQYKRFIKVNLRKNTQISLKEGKFIHVKPGTAFDIHPSAKIIVDAPIIWGNDTIKGLKMPTGLRMEADTTLQILNNHISRYGKAPYNLRYGAYIEIINGGKLTIGQGAANVNLTIMCSKEVKIGDGVRIGRNVSIRDFNGTHAIINDSYVNCAPVFIEDHCWLCSGCSILPGVTIGEGSVVAANALVTKSCPPKSLVAGVPAKVIKSDIEWY